MLHVEISVSAISRTFNVSRNTLFEENATESRETRTRKEIDTRRTDKKESKSRIKIEDDNSESRRQTRKKSRI